MRISIITTTIQKCRNITLSGQSNVAKKFVKQGSKITDESWNSIPENLRISFSKLYNKTGKSFLKKAYKELVKSMELKGFAPKNLKFKDCGESVEAIFDECFNRIWYSDRYISSIEKSNQIGSLAYQLAQCRQSVDLIRSPSVGVERYVETLSQRVLDNNLKDSPFNEGFKQHYLAAVEKGEGEDFLKSVKFFYCKKLLPKICENFSKAVKMTKIEETPAQKILIEEQLVALKSYSNGSKDNLQVAEAFLAESEIKNYYKIFEDFCNKFLNK